MPGSTADPFPISGGWVEPEVADEFPTLGLRCTLVPGGTRRTPRVVRRQLEELSDAVDARRAIGLRQRAVVSAYRVFGRQLGLDPDADHGPLESALIDRMLRGEFVPRGLPADACTIATVETGVPVWAIDGDRVRGSLGIGIAEDALAIADRERALAPLLGLPGPDLAVGPRSKSCALYAVVAPGAPEAAVDEALWIAASIASERG